jgi:hypothetical protein
MDYEDELLDLVNKNDRLVGTILRSQTNDLKHKGFLRAAEALFKIVPASFGSHAAKCISAPRQAA